MQYHPHAAEEFFEKYSNNTIYKARKTLSWNDELPGAGVFNFHKDLVLTKNGLSKSKWDLPDYFKNVKIGFHRESNWKKGYFQSAGIGQEFVIDANNEIEIWMKNLIRKYANIS